MANKNVVSHMKEITRSQQEIEHKLQRVEELRKRLRARTELTADESDKLEAELEDVKKGILDNEAKLKSYYGENRKSFMFAVMLMFFSFLFYGLYLMVYGHGR
ncbi:Hypothetical protein NTJ_10904 [Nesidiocoris tenuis]|uniref:Coiled-coil domain-containing protein 167 n=1 Tax=Nesidiocoris tenuis TaxID=355587 RepID=A0ABN7B2N8_9HEMI|nr:Hypothetical protein NTJ_10904 [Nesidiocoris tenuis]